MGRPIGIIVLFMAGLLIANTDVTFLVGSDTHYTSSTSNQAVVDDMNNLPGKAYPDAVDGGTIDTPRGVLLLGDLVDVGNSRSTEAQWSYFTAHFGVSGGEGRCNYPSYETWGNHDGGPEEYTKWVTNCHVQEEIRKRTARRTGLTAVSSNGKFYSWDWDDVHFVSLGIYPGNVYVNPTEDPVWHSPQYSLDFLIEDLEENVGTSGRPVVLMHHYDVTSSARWWTQADHLNYANAIKGYNVILIMYGHTHGNGVGTWRELDAGTSFPYLNDGSIRSGTYYVLHITDGKMTISQRSSSGTWGSVQTTRTIDMGQQTATLVNAGLPATSGVWTLNFGNKKVSMPVVTQEKHGRIEVYDVRGNLVQTVSVADGTAFLKPGSKHVRTAAGVYLVKAFTGSRCAARQKVTIVE